MVTEADKAIEEAKEHLTKAMIILSRVLSGDVYGLSEYKKEVQYEIPMIMSKIAIPLCALREIRPD